MKKMITASLLVIIFSLPGVLSRANSPAIKIYDWPELGVKYYENVNDVGTPFFMVTEVLPNTCAEWTGIMKGDLLIEIYTKRFNQEGEDIPIAKARSWFPPTIFALDGTSYYIKFHRGIEVIDRRARFNNGDRFK